MQYVFWTSHQLVSPNSLWVAWMLNFLLQNLMLLYCSHLLMYSFLAHTQRKPHLLWFPSPQPQQQTLLCNHMHKRTVELSTDTHCIHKIKTMELWPICHSYEKYISKLFAHHEKRSHSTSVLRRYFRVWGHWWLIRVDLLTKAYCAIRYSFNVPQYLTYDQFISNMDSWDCTKFDWIMSVCLDIWFLLHATCYRPTDIEFPAA